MFLFSGRYINKSGYCHVPVIKPSGSLVCRSNQVKKFADRSTDYQGFFHCETITHDPPDSWRTFSLTLTCSTESPRLLGVNRPAILKCYMKFCTFVFSVTYISVDLGYEYYTFLYRIMTPLNGSQVLLLKR